MTESVPMTRTRTFVLGVLVALAGAYEVHWWASSLRATLAQLRDLDALDRAAADIKAQVAS